MVIGVRNGLTADTERMDCWRAVLGVKVRVGVWCVRKGRRRRRKRKRRKEEK